MGKTPTVWLVTHEDHGGGRILAPIAAFQELGWKVRLFHEVALPPHIQQRDGDVRVPAFSWETISLRFRPFAECPFASVTRLLSPIRQAIRRGAHIKAADRYLNTGWSFRAFNNENGTVLVFRNKLRRFSNDFVSVFVYDSISDSIALINVAANRLLHGAAIFQAIGKVRPDLIDRDLARWCFDGPVRFHQNGSLSSRGSSRGTGRWSFDPASGRGVFDGRPLQIVDPDLFQHSPEVDRAYDLIWKDLPASRPIRRLAAHLQPGNELPPPDLVLVADLPMLAAGLHVSRRYGCPLIYDAHEWWAEQERVWNPHNVRRQETIAQLERLLYPECDQRLTCGARLASAMGAQTGTHFECLYTAAALARGQSDGRVPDDGGVDRFWQGAGLPAGARVALFVGNLTAERSLEDLMEASAQLDDGHYLVVIGAGLYLPRMHQALAATGNPDRVKFLGAMTFERLTAYVKHAHIGVIPYQPAVVARPFYFSMGMPSKFSDYHQAGLPILVHADMQECSDIIREQGIGFIWEGAGGTDLGRAMRQALSDRQGLDRCRAAYSTAPRLFDLDRLIGDLQSLVSRPQQERRQEGVPA